MIVVISIYIVYPTSRGQNKTNEYFIANSNLTDQSPMNFSYLTNPNYAKDILATYYLDDDKKIMIIKETNINKTIKKERKKREKK